MLILSGACHREVEKQEKEIRIVVLSPEVAEIIAGLGAVGQIVGITDECDYPPELYQIAKVGNFGSIRKETVLGLKPDIVFTSALEQDALATELGKLGLRVEKVYPRKLDELPTTVLRIGNLIGRESEARAMADSLTASISAMREETAGKPRPKVYLEIYRNPLMSVSDSSFVGEVIEAAGGDNIFSRLERDYARVDPEDVVAARPDIMICYSQDSLESILARKGWQDIPAIKTRRVYFEKDIDPDLIQRASPRTVEGLSRLHELFGR
jgi:iron complex transport system substrate-binding protein